jgi:hypothetical protein
MTSPPLGMRLCPTRTDGEASLIAHVITDAQCQKRQREHFHKCPTCVHGNARSGPGAPAAPPAAEPAAQPVAAVAGATTV